MAKEEKKYYAGTGHRKTSIARVKLIPGKGKITVNGRDVEDYFPNKILIMDLKQPLDLTNTTAILNSIRIDPDSMKTINDLPNGYLIVDIVYGGEGT